MCFHIIFHYNCNGCLSHQAKKAEICLRERGEEKQKQVCPHHLLRKLPVFSFSACMHAQSLKSCWTLCNLMDCRLPGSSVHGDSPGKNTGLGYRAFLQGIFPTQGSNLHLLCLLHWQVGSLSPVPPGKPVNHTSFINYFKNCDSTIKVEEH